MKDEKVSFLKKAAGISDEVLIKSFTAKEKSKEVEKNSVTVADPSLTFIVYSSQDKYFDDEFGLKNVNEFLKNYKNFDTVKESKNSIIFSDKEKKITFRKLDSDVVDEIPIPKIDVKGYTYISLTKTDIEKILDGYKENKDLSDYASFSIDKKDNLTMKIGEEDYENIFELKVAKIKRTGDAEIKFITDINNSHKLFKSLDNHRDGNKVTMYLKDNSSPMVIVESNPVTLTKYYIASITIDEDFDKE